MTIIYAIILFIFLIFPHELGHFLVAKAAGVKVNEFSFGMGPALYSKQGKETLYSVRLLPLGGYCAMEGENEESEDSRAFNNKPWWAKILVLIAGSAMNVAIAVLALSLLMGVAGSPTTVIDEVQTGSPAMEAGIEAGDRILDIDGKEIATWNDLTGVVGQSAETISVTLSRDDQEITVEIVPTMDQEQDRYIIGITPKMSHSPLTAAIKGTQATWSLTRSMFDSLKMLVTGQVPASDLSGPVGIVSMAGDTTQYGWTYFVFLVALMSLNLAVINMLPLPALDGGRLLFVLIRKVTGKMISDDLEGKIHGIGMVLLFALMIFVTWNDVARLFA